MDKKRYDDPQLEVTLFVPTDGISVSNTDPDFDNQDNWSYGTLTL